MFEALRLLLFKQCDRNCEGCCNKDWDLDSLPKVESYAGYCTIMLTGGEPLLHPDFVLQVVQNIRQENKEAPIYVYTAKVNDIEGFLKVLEVVDGVTLTLHENFDVKPFNQLNQAIYKHGLHKNKSLRLNIFKEVNADKVESKGWLVKRDMVWIKNCPLPKNEVFMRL